MKDDVQPGRALQRQIDQREIEVSRGDPRPREPERQHQQEKIAELELEEIPPADGKVKRASLMEVCSQKYRRLAAMYQIHEKPKVNGVKR